MEQLLLVDENASWLVDKEARKAAAVCNARWAGLGRKKLIAFRHQQPRSTFQSL